MIEYHKDYMIMYVFGSCFKILHLHLRKRNRLRKLGKNDMYFQIYLYTMLLNIFITSY
jgi:hypothetical protein